jgi:threonine/homoserine/homoserine lactone efflux protein
LDGPKAAELQAHLLARKPPRQQQVTPSWFDHPSAGLLASQQRGSAKGLSRVDVTTLMTYAAAHAAVTVAPGPIMAVIITRTLTHDLGGAAGFTAGVCLGKMLAILAIAVGLGVWAEDSAQWIKLFRVAGSAYLLWLAFQMWQAAYAGLGPERPRRGWVSATTAGTAFSLFSPFTFVFYLMVLPSVIPTGLNHPSSVTVVMLVTVAVVGGLMTAVMLLAHRFRRIVSSPGASIAFNRGMAVTLALTSYSLLIL